MAEARAFDAANRFQIFVRQAGPGRRQIRPQFKAFILAADTRQAPVIVAWMNDEEQMVGARLLDGGPKRHSHRQFQNMSVAGIHDSPAHERFSPQFRGAVGNLCLHEAAGDGQRRVETAIVRFGICLVENRFQSFQQDGQGQPGECPRGGGAERAIVDQIDRQHEAGIERGVNGFDMVFRNAEGGEIIAAEMLPDQSERTIGLTVFAQRRTALVVIEGALRRVINTADVIDDAVCAGCDPFGRPAADQACLREKPGQHDARQQFVGMEATGMGNEEVRDHVRMRLVACGSSAWEWAPDTLCRTASQPAIRNGG